MLYRVIYNFIFLSVKILLRILLVLLTFSSVVVPIESYLDSMEFTSHKKQIIDIDDDMFIDAIVLKTSVEFESDGEFFNQPFIRISPFPELIFGIRIGENFRNKQKFLQYSLVYLPPPC